MMKSQLFVGHLEPSPTLLQPVQNTMFIKPDGGIWTSTYLGKEHGSDWVRYLRNLNEGRVSLNGYLLYPEKDLNIYIIDTYEDLEKLMAKYSCVPQYVKEMGFELPSVYGINFEEFSKQYDGLHLTYEGQINTRHSLSFQFNDGSFEAIHRKYNLYGYDVECTWFSKWCFDKVEPLGELIFS